MTDLFTVGDVVYLPVPARWWRRWWWWHMRRKQPHCATITEADRDTGILELESSLYGREYGIDE